jgi:hypothetical protein
MLRNYFPLWNQSSYSGCHINPELYAAYECKCKAHTGNTCRRLDLFIIQCDILIAAFRLLLHLLIPLLRELAVINCTMQMHWDCPHKTWLIADVSHCYPLLHSRFTNSSYIASFKMICFYTNVMSSFTY